MADTTNECRDELIRSVTKLKTSFNLSQFVRQHGYERDLVDQVAEQMLRDMCIKFASDGDVSETERRKAGRLAAVLEISPERLAQFQASAAEIALEKEVSNAEQDGVVTQAEFGKLQLMSESLNVQLPERYRVGSFDRAESSDGLDLVADEEASEQPVVRLARPPFLAFFGRWNNDEAMDRAIMIGSAILAAGSCVAVLSLFGLPDPPMASLKLTDNLLIPIYGLLALLVGYLGFRIARCVTAKMNGELSLALDLALVTLDIAVVMVLVGFKIQAQQVGPEFLGFYFVSGILLVLIGRFLRAKTDSWIPVFAFVGAWELTGILRVLYGLNCGMKHFELLALMLVVGPLLMLLATVVSLSSRGNGSWGFGSGCSSSCGSSCGGGGCGGSGCGGCGN